MSDDQDLPADDAPGLPHWNFPAAKLQARRPTTATPVQALPFNPDAAVQRLWGELPYQWQLLVNARGGTWKIIDTARLTDHPELSRYRGSYLDYVYGCVDRSPVTGQLTVYLLRSGLVNQAACENLLLHEAGHLYDFCYRDTYGWLASDGVMFLYAAAMEMPPGQSRLEWFAFTFNAWLDRGNKLHGTPHTDWFWWMLMGPENVVGT